MVVSNGLDVTCEGRFFLITTAQQRKMDNYYDSVKILSIRNVQDFKPIALDLTKSEFTYELKKDLIDSINIDINPIRDGIEEILSEE